MIEHTVASAGPHTDPLATAAGAYLLSGNEALARAALVSGVGFACSYPGSPITETQGMMLLAAARPAHSGLHAEWSVNEHVALHAATGASWSGVRTLVTMKQVGLHVASDPAAYLAYAGVKGGLVLGIGTDPGANSSTGEFDVRWLVREMHWPLVEPATVQEVYDFACRAWELSEASGRPVLFHMPAPLCHQMAVIQVGALGRAPTPGRFVPDIESFVNVGGRAVKNHARLLDRLRAVGDQAASWHKASKPAGHGRRGVVVAGMHYPLLQEILRTLDADTTPVLKLGLSHPLDRLSLVGFAEGLDELLVLEELDGFLSSGVQALMNQCRLPVWVSSSNGPDGLAAGQMGYEAALDAVAGFLGITLPPRVTVDLPTLPARPGTFCPGCSHRSPLLAIREVLGETGVYGGDIGCSSLPPHASDWLTCMGSGIGIAQGVAAVSRGQKVIASIGDSTFFHSGLPAVLNAQQQGTNLVLVVLDNQYVAMTGHQPSPNTESGKGGVAAGAPTVSIATALTGLGVSDVTHVDAYELPRLRHALAQALGRPGLSVLVVGGECRLQFAKREPERIEALPLYAIIPELCQRCGGCYEDLGCVAIHDKGGQLSIDPEACTRCGLCYEVCSDKAIIPYHLLEQETL